MKSPIILLLVLLSFSLSCSRQGSGAQTATLPGASSESVAEQPKSTNFALTKGMPADTVTDEVTTRPRTARSFATRTSPSRLLPHPKLNIA
jgi:hypothetical protein